MSWHPNWHPNITAMSLNLALLGTLGMSGEAFAHGRFPASSDLLVDPSDPQHLVTRTSYGLVGSHDGGQSWRWTCSDAVGFDSDVEDPSLGITADGSVLAGVFDGLSATHDGCNWSFLPGMDGGLEGKYVVDLVVEPGGQGVVALTSNGLGQAMFEVGLWESSDAGHSFAALGSPPPVDFLARSILVSPSDPDRVYLSGRDGMLSDQPVLMRSDDRGSSWQRKPVDTGTGEAFIPTLVAVDPTDADRLLLRAELREQDAVVRTDLLASEDGGDSFQLVYSTPAALSAWSLSPDGMRLALGGEEDGLLMGAMDSLALEQVSSLRVRCLTWQDAGLYACADEFVDGFSLGLSTDDGRTFTPLMLIGSPCGPPACGDDSDVGQHCAPRWIEESKELAAPETCNDPEPPASDAGCGCRLPGSSHRGGPLWLVASALLGLGLRRRFRAGSS